MNYIGIDPGKSGGMACLGRIVIDPFKFTNATEADIASFLRSWGAGFDGATYAVIERVSSSPQMGVVSAFSFGRSYGFLRGLLIAEKIPFVEVSPQKWQKAMGCLSKGDKNRTKAKAQQLYPNEKITHAIADALLIATYCKQHHSELF